MDIKNKVIVITGSSQGFGKALAAAFVKGGANVIISSDNPETLNSTALEIGADPIVADVTSFSEVSHLVSAVTEKYRRIDIWVNNAGIQIAPSNFEDIDIEKFERLMKINLFGYFYGCRAVLPVLKKQGEGMIININSTAGLGGKPGIAAYSSSKFAVKGLTESLREELKGSEIKVYGIFPGGMQTEIYKEKYPVDFAEYMEVEYAIDKVMENLGKTDPESDLVIRRPAK